MVKMAQDQADSRETQLGGCIFSTWIYLVSNPWYDWTGPDFTTILINGTQSRNFFTSLFSHLLQKVSSCLALSK